ncbi:MAG TPA: hypothetical protein VGI46_00950 [Candidatus Acidoferrum sp.]|jgi:hypothetical protein
MGAWGTGILSDDTVRDVHADYLDLFNRGESREAIREQLLETYAESVRDSDEGPLIWIGIAKAQWDCSHLEPLVLSKIREIVSGGHGLDRWAEQGERLLQRRKTALSEFLGKLETSNSRPRTPRKAIKRKSIFEPGDCVAARLQDGDWGAILVLQGEPESDDPYKETYGTNLVVALRYKSPELPSLKVFEKREFLYLTHHFWKDHLKISYVTALRSRKVKDRFVRVGTIQLRTTDPRTAKTYSSWPNQLDDMYLQDQWDRGVRD